MIEQEVELIYGLTSTNGVEWDKENGPGRTLERPGARGLTTLITTRRLP